MDVTCVKYKSVTPRVTIDSVCAAPEQVRVVPPKEKKRAPPAALENEKCQRMSAMLLNDKMKNLIEYTHALQHRIDKEHIYLKDLEYELTIFCHYVVNQDKY